MLDNERLLKELLECFEQEAQEHLAALSSLVLSLERESEPPERQRLIESVFRRVHTLKGAAHAVNQVGVAHRCQQLESLLSDLKRGEIPLDLQLFDRLHRDLDALAGIEAGHAAPPAPAEPDTAPDTAPGAEGGLAPATGSGGGSGAAALERPQVVAKGSPTAGGEKPGARPAADETVRVSQRLLESLLLQSEELVSAKLAAAALHEELCAAASELAAHGGERSRALEIARRALKGMPPETQAGSPAMLLEHGCQRERLTEGRLRLLAKSAEKHQWALQALVDPLMEDMKKLHLLPFSHLAEPFSKLVRDLARQLGKEAELESVGMELEVDRRILTELKEPLLHLVRNMIDHGIEEPAERLKKGKPEKGKVRIEIRLHDANRAELRISDDGGGIDIARVKEAALKEELATREALDRMSEPDLVQLIFESGVSTSRMVSSISGRGIGLAIVREALEKLGGHATVESVPGKGTFFRLVFPLSFAMMRGLLVRAAGRDCIVPAANVELSGRVPVSGIKSVENRETVVVNGEVVALAHLGRVLGVEGGAPSPDGQRSFVLLETGAKRIAFSVDQVAGVQEILVKPLGSQLSRVRNVSGATVLGNGLTVPVLNVADLFRSAFSDQSPFTAAPAASAPGQARRSVLVAEDSITSRTLLKNILESAGFLVRTAIDGLDALTQLKTESCDIVISDVEMPRLDGFQLTAALRADSRFANLPVVLVTGLESRADRERGIDAGASAYLVKSSFDQGSLIDVIRKLT